MALGIREEGVGQAMGIDDTGVGAPKPGLDGGEGRFQLLDSLAAAQGEVTGSAGLGILVEGIELVTGTVVPGNHEFADLCMGDTVIVRPGVQKLLSSGAGSSHPRPRRVVQPAVDHPTVATGDAGCLPLGALQYPHTSSLACETGGDGTADNTGTDYNGFDFGLPSQSRDLRSDVVARDRWTR